MIDAAPPTVAYTFRVREDVARDIEREAKKRRLRRSEELRRRLDFYADYHRHQKAPAKKKLR